MEETKTKIGIFGHYGNGNLGDEAIIETVIQNLRLRLPNAELYGFSIAPQDTEQRYGIPAYPIRSFGEPTDAPTVPVAKTENERESNEGAERLAGFKDTLKTIPLLGLFLKILARLFYLSTDAIDEWRFLRRSYCRLKGFKLLLITGSNQFLDNFGGPWGFPYTLLKWSILAKLAGAKLVYASMGAGPLDSPVSRLLVRVALLFSDYTSFRDEGSKRLIETVGFRNKGQVFPDLAHALLFDSQQQPTPTPHQSTARPKVGINPMPTYDPRYWCFPDADKYQSYVQKLGAFTSALLREDYPVFFFDTMPKDEHVIHDVIACVDDGVQAKLSPDAIRISRSVNELMQTYTCFDIVIATRFHGTLLSLLAERPVLGICYYRKSRELLRDMGQEDYAVDLDTFSVDDLINRFKALETNRAAEVGKIRSKKGQYSEDLKTQFDLITELVG